jgi:hypothetical protein
MFRDRLSAAVRRRQARSSCLGEACGVEKPQPGPAVARDHPIGLEAAQDSPGHLAAGADQRWQVGTRQHAWLPEEHRAVLLKHPRHPSGGVLVKKTIETSNNGLEGQEDVLEKVNGQAGVAGGHRLQFPPRPERDAARRQGQHFGGGRPARHRQQRRKPASADDARDHLASVERRSPIGDMTFEHEARQRLVALGNDGLTGLEATNLGEPDQKLASLGTRTAERLAEDPGEALRIPGGGQCSDVRIALITR